VFALPLEQAAPANAVLLWSVPPELRPVALGVAEVLNHVLGDVPLPPLLGLLQQHSGDWRLTMCVCAAFLALAAALFGCARWVLPLRGGDAQEVQVLVLEGADLAAESSEESEGALLAEPLLP
jgi:hypothetical protein